MFRGRRPKRSLQRSRLFFSEGRSGAAWTADGSKVIVAANLSGRYNLRTYRQPSESRRPYGIIDWKTMLAQEYPQLQEYEKSLLGDPTKDAKVYADDSPITYVRNAKLPLLVLQVDNDIRVPKEEAEQVVALLRAMGEPWTPINTTSRLPLRQGGEPDLRSSAYDRWVRALFEMTADKGRR